MSTGDQRRSLALSAWPRQLPAGDLPPAALAPFASGSAPGRARRFAQAVAWKRGKLRWDSGVAAPLAAARRAALGPAAAGPPRALVRVDEFPHARAFDSGGRFGTDAFRRFHAVLAEAGVPYLIAVTPRVSRDYLDPAVSESRELDAGEVEQLGAMADAGMTFAQHGLDHRTRHANPRRHSELCGLGPAATAARIDSGRQTLAEIGIQAPVFVPPFNRFDSTQYELLAERFEVVCGGPESIRLLGFSPTPVWRGEAVYLPSYAPLYARSATVEAGLRPLLEAETGIWAPVTLHWGWELDDDFAGLRRLCKQLAPIAADWGELLRAAAAVRGD
ncbi:MAG: DUF2334 domain-containing protein [Solirubrobacterales bacterium]